jgi:hypothetical protein
MDPTQKGELVEGELLAVDSRTAGVSVGMKINLGNYESADASMWLSGIPVGATAAEIDAMIETAEVSFERLKPRLQALAQQIREGRHARR